MELMKGGELLDLLRRQHSFTEAQASGLFRQLVSAVSFMHQKRVVHRDLKPEVRSITHYPTHRTCTRYKLMSCF